MTYWNFTSLLKIWYQHQSADPSKQKRDWCGLQGEKRDVQLTLNAVAPSEDEDSRIRRMARERGFTGDICDECGSSQMVRNGTCLKCNACGATTGCS